MLRKDGELAFKKFGESEFIPIYKPGDWLSARNQRSSQNKPVTKVISGFGNKMYAVQDGELFSREGVSFRNPSGVSWKTTGVRGVKDVTANNFGVFVLLTDGRMIKLDGKEIVNNDYSRRMGSLFKYLADLLLRQPCMEISMYLFIIFLHNLLVFMFKLLMGFKGPNNVCGELPHSLFHS